MVKVPPSSAAGPVNLVFTQLDGESFVEPQRFSYGVDVAAATSTLVPPIGNPVLSLYGYGILNGPSTPPTVPTVTVGGQPVRNLAVNLNAVYIPQGLFLQLPNGTPGPADIVVTSNTGTGTLKAGITHIPFCYGYSGKRVFTTALRHTSQLALCAAEQSNSGVRPSRSQVDKYLIPGGAAGLGYVAMAITRTAYNFGPRCQGEYSNGFQSGMIHRKVLQLRRRAPVYCLQISLP